MLKKVIFFVIVIVIGIAAIRFWTPEDTWLCQNNEWVKHGNPSNPAPSTGCGELLVGGDRDEHGCIGSAGYSWCEAKSKCLRIFEEDCPTADYKNGTYIIEGQRVALINGYNEEAIPDSADKVITKYFGNEARADFNKDGLEDVAFLLTQATGGTGLFYYTAVALGSADGFVPVGTDLIGDRIAPQNTEYKDDIITVNYADRAANESFAVAPSIGLSKYYKIIDGYLRPVVPPLNQIESEAHQAIKQMLISKYPKYAKTLQINVRQETDEYAVGAIGFESGAPGGQYLAVKKDDNWQFVYEGNGSIDCVKIKQDYNFPVEMLAGFCD